MGFSPLTRANHIRRVVGSWSGATLLWIVAWSCPGPQGLSGQELSGRDPPSLERLTYLEATPFFIAVGHRWRIGDGRRALGFEIGGGSLRTVTLVSGGPDFREIIRVGLSGVAALGEATHLDVGVLTGIEDYLLCGASDCWPDGFVAVRAGLVRGRGWLAWGTRLTLVRVSGDIVLTWTPVHVRLRR